MHIYIWFFEKYSFFYLLLLLLLFEQPSDVDSKYLYVCCESSIFVQTKNDSMIRMILIKWKHYFYSAYLILQQRAGHSNSITIYWTFEQFKVFIASLWMYLTYGYVSKLSLPNFIDQPWKKLNLSSNKNVRTNNILYCIHPNRFD